MPRGSLTPLGRQLRSVLANLRPTVGNNIRSPNGNFQCHGAAKEYHETRTITKAGNQRRKRNSNVRRQSAAATVTKVQDGGWDEDHGVYWNEEPGLDYVPDALPGKIAGPGRIRRVQPFFNKENAPTVYAAPEGRLKLSKDLRIHNALLARKCEEVLGENGGPSISKTASRTRRYEEFDRKPSTATPLAKIPLQKRRERTEAYSSHDAEFNRKNRALKFRATDSQAPVQSHLSEVLGREAEKNQNDSQSGELRIDTAVNGYVLLSDEAHSQIPSAVGESAAEQEQYARATAYQSNYSQPKRGGGPRSPTHDLHDLYLNEALAWEPGTEKNDDHERQELNIRRIVTENSAWDSRPHTQPAANTVPIVSEQKSQEGLDLNVLPIKKEAFGLSWVKPKVLDENLRLNVAAQSPEYDPRLEDALALEDSKRASHHEKRELRLNHGATKSSERHSLVNTHSAVHTSVGKVSERKSEAIDAAYRHFEVAQHHIEGPWGLSSRHWDDRLKAEPTYSMIDLENNPGLSHDGAASRLQDHETTKLSEMTHDGAASSVQKDESTASNTLVWNAEEAIDKKLDDEFDDDPLALHDDGDNLETDDEFVTVEHSFARLLNRYVRYTNTAEGVPKIPAETPFVLSDEEDALLKCRGYIFNNIKGWAEITTLPDSFKAATRLDQLKSRHGPASVPKFVIGHLLKRSYVSARALRVLIPLTWATLDFHNSPERHESLHEDDIFDSFKRLHRHARKVWPAALETLPDILLRHLPHNRAVNERVAEYTPFSPQLSNEQLEALTAKLNKAMRWLAVPTSIEPFKNLSIQETAIIKILRFMAEHDPPLGINREGYRAVFLVQLGQPKSLTDRQWAELKALSWPPWKEERTAMDADIAVEPHGKSKAAQTLQQMRDAGYALKGWERAAAIYTGWDTDHTPTIQTRRTFIHSRSTITSGAATWAARISTTRTVQEAWACYLAYEDEKMPPNQDVYLAIFRRLYEDELRVQGSRKYQREVESQMKLLPGDTLEIEPLPPSTHLYTYTRTSPPTVDGLYRQLVNRGVYFSSHCLAFLVANAGSLPLGIEYLFHDESQHSEMRSLLYRDNQHALPFVPIHVFSAFLELLGRFSKVPVSTALPRGSRTLHLRPQYKANEILPNRRINRDHPLGLAIELLNRRRPPYIPAWNHVLRALGHESSHENLLTIFVSADAGYRSFGPAKQDAAPRAAITAFHLIRKVMSLAKDTGMDLDAEGLLALCQAVENAAIGCWRILESEQVRIGKPEESTATHTSLVSDAAQLLQSLEHVQCVKEEFDILVGKQGKEEPDHEMADGGLTLPRLLEVPGPALLHAYIRALGWAADHQGVLHIVRWMVANSTELAERRARSHNGERIMRRTVLATKVFLERTWLSRTSEKRAKDLEVGSDFEADKDTEDLNDTNMKDMSERQLLCRLQSPAAEGIVSEVRELIESVEDWGGWPTDAEVEGYIQHYRYQYFI